MVTPTVKESIEAEHMALKQLACDFLGGKDAALVSVNLLEVLLLKVSTEANEACYERIRNDTFFLAGTDRRKPII